MSTLPLAAVSSVLTALEAEKEDAQLGPQGAQALDNAGYESVREAQFPFPVLNPLSSSLDTGGGANCSGRRRGIGSVQA